MAKKQNLANVFRCALKSLLRPHRHIPHMAEKWAGVRLVSRPRVLRREAVVP